MWHRVALVRTDDSEERIASMIRVERMSELATTLAVIKNFANVLGSVISSTLKMEATRYSEEQMLTGPTRRYIQEDGAHLICWSDNEI
jgi:hypothetical protein